MSGMRPQIIERLFGLDPTIRRTRTAVWKNCIFSTVSVQHLLQPLDSSVVGGSGAT